MRYALIEPYAYAVIKWNPKTESLTYTIIEPPLTKKEKEKLEKLKNLIIDLLDINLMDVKNISEVQNYLKEKLDRIISDYDIKLTDVEYNKILYYIYRDFLGLERIEPLMHDPEIEDISCDGAGIPIFIFHRKYGSLRTNIVFEDNEELNRFITKLAQRCGKHISVAEPLLDGALPDGSRLQATFSAGGDIATRGSTFTIRKFSKDPLTIVDFMRFGTIPALISAYLWVAIEYRKSILIAGGTATGKTSALNALSLFIHPEAKIVSIEDTPELRLPHEHWIAKIARPGYGPEGAGGKKKGEISMFDLLKAALRERPDVIVVGEVRGEEAYVLFQGMASVPGKEEVFVIKPDNSAGLMKIKDLYGRSLNGWKALSVDVEKKKVTIAPIRRCEKHLGKTLMYEIITNSGKRIKVSNDHSVFTLNSHGMEAIPVDSLKPGDEICVLGESISDYRKEKTLNLIELLPNSRVLAPKLVGKAVRKIGWEKANKICGVKSINDYYRKENCSALKADKFKKLMEEAGVEWKPKDVIIKFDNKSEQFKGEIRITRELLRLLGYFISEGTLNTANKNNSIALYNKNKTILKDMEKCIIKVTGKKPKKRTTKGFGSSTELRFNHKVLFELLKKECKHGSRNKKIPSFLFGLAKEEIGEFLSALYAGDGSINKKHVSYCTISEKLAKDLSMLLLSLKINPHIYQVMEKGKKLYFVEFHSAKDFENFNTYVKPVGKKINKKKGRKSTHSPIITDTIKEIRKKRCSPNQAFYDLNVPGLQTFTGGLGGVVLHNTGHQGLATLHAESVEAVINRLMTRPINLSPGLLQHLDIVLVMGFSRIKGIDIRRVKEVVEITGVDPETGKPLTNQLFRWVPANDYFEFSSDRSYVLNEIIEEKGIPEESIWEEIRRRADILEWMKKENIRYYKDVGRIIATYYKNPEEILKRVYSSKLSSLKKNENKGEEK